MTVRPLPPLPILPPLPKDDGDASLFEGDVVVQPVRQVRKLAVTFASPWEPVVKLDGRRVVDHARREDRRVFTWIGRALPSLYRALEDQHAVYADVDDERVTIVDVVHLESQVFLDHAQVRRVVGTGVIEFAPFAILGAIPSRNELMGRLRGMYATGARVEVRREENGRLLGCRTVQVGRSDPR